MKYSANSVWENRRRMIKDEIIQRSMRRMNIDEVVV